MQALVSLAVLEARFQYDFYMHADDDSYVRLDLVLELLVCTLCLPQPAVQCTHMFLGLSATHPRVQVTAQLRKLLTQRAVAGCLFPRAAGGQPKAALLLGLHLGWDRQPLHCAYQEHQQQVAHACGAGED
jgi:hypothetical protein